MMTFSDRLHSGFALVAQSGDDDGRDLVDPLPQPEDIEIAAESSEDIPRRHGGRKRRRNAA